MICPISSAGISAEPGKTRSDLREIHHILFGGDKLALLHLTKLIDPAVVGGDQQMTLSEVRASSKVPNFPL